MHYRVFGVQRSGENPWTQKPSFLNPAAAALARCGVPRER